MPEMKHPVSRVLYVSIEPGVIEVRNGGATGRFRGDGTWISGEIKHADPHFCSWFDLRCSPPVEAAGDGEKVAYRNVISG